MSGQGFTGDQAPETLLAVAGTEPARAPQASKARTALLKMHRTAHLRTVYPLSVVRVALAGSREPTATFN
jgi:hypothetical protein